MIGMGVVYLIFVSVGLPKGDLAGLDYKTQCSSFLTIDFHGCELRDANDIYAIFLKIATCDGDGLYSLINRTSANCLNLCSVMFPDNTCNGTSDSRCARLG